ncbi:MAG: glucose-6-phosphate isomerase [Betaproteobacteria bacterium]|nr:glucose-6-phosphate isomerase [Betaproteobacteria bacterium]MDE1980768.1 glucose-6-phosphate isomerase [Betaproteobacteria bacterium]MDE2131145.1 glucose-6-phosphate isomerase [Betaproteobacteria bacterium]MDE2211246.1 glucose-6-phosphate isomerase [Betaproteobacteria bacterium]
MPDLNRTPAWSALEQHQRTVAPLHLRDLFARDPGRFERLSLHAGPLFLDYSKNRVTDETLTLLLALANESKLSEWIERLFRGERVNGTERRAALHTALRQRGNAPVLLDGQDVMPDVRRVQEQMRKFSGSVRSGDWRGYTGQPITDVVNIGIGGSDLGPAMVVSALDADCGPLRLHFVSNVDGADLSRTLRTLSPEQTLFVIASKTFTTQETLLNAHSARDWFLAQARDPVHVARHFVAVSTQRDEVVRFGIDPDHMFEFWDWVGGRYSLWSAIGLPIALAIGMDRFDALLAGAHEMDEHFRHSPLARNMPVLMGLLGVWYINFFGSQTQAILPYDQGMHRFVSHIQQVVMESSGKSVTREGRPVHCATGSVVWGGPGTNGQHAYFQLLHQGTPLVPADFLAPIESRTPLGEHHRVLLSNFLAQPEALMRGKTAAEVRQELERSGLKGDDLERLVPHRCFSGNRPSNTLLFQKLDARTLGALIALYEHKTFVQSVLWDINAFDQWGVELGKQLARDLLSELSGAPGRAPHDASTSGLLAYVRSRLPGN